VGLQDRPDQEVCPGCQEKMVKADKMESQAQVVQLVLQVNEVYLECLVYQALKVTEAFLVLMERKET